jgi:REP element-mobilizing transposase RayT
MPSTYLSLHYHLVFSTKNREPSLDPAWRGRFFSYLGGIVSNLDGIPEQIGGVADHVHLLVGLKATHCLADFMRDLKKRSSLWIHDELHVPDFAWQEGYAGFTVSPTARGGVRGYIADQEKHHHTTGLLFRDELIELLKAADIAYDPKYLD